MTPDERKRRIALVFVEIHAGAENGVEATAARRLAPYMQAVIGDGAGNERWGTERKTGFEPATPTLAT